MKIIKFRGKRIDNNEWIYGYFYVETQHVSKPYSMIKNSDLNQAVTPESVGQFTGLKDKNGKEIYEGDIIKQKSSLGTYTIIWDKCGFKKEGNADGISAFNKKNEGIFDIFIYEGENKNKINYYAIEIIGNIYENPELLK